MKLTKIMLATVCSLLLAFSVGSISHAQTVSSGTTSSSGAAIAMPICFTFSTNIRYGSDDATSGQGYITQLQTFLSNQGYFNSANLGTGHFGPLTLSAVEKYQAANGIPSTGFVGPLTRASMNNTCGINPNPTPEPTPTPLPPTSSPITLYSVNPSNGQTGTTVTLGGFGFTSSNTVLFGGSVAARDVPIASSIAIACTTNPTCHGGINQTLTFTVPTSLSPSCPAGGMCPMYMRLVTPGEYDITVQNANGTSNTIPFTVTALPGSSQPLTIAGLDAPASLTTAQTGTWTVHALANTGIGNLHYTVSWGDGSGVPASAIMAPQSFPTATTSSTFTHQYQYPDTYTQVFTVTDDAGNTVLASSTVTVTSPIYY